MGMERAPTGRPTRGRPRGTPLRGKVERGRPRGTPLRGKVAGGRSTRDAPTGKVERGCPRGTPLRGLGKIRKWEGRCGQGEGGMGPRMREDNGGGGDDGGGMGHIPVSTGAGSPWEQREGKGFSLWNDGLYGDGRFANRPYGRRSGCMGAIYFHSNHGRGRPRGTPLRGKVERACTRDAPMERARPRGTLLRGKVWGRLSLGRRDSSRDSE